MISEKFQKKDGATMKSILTIILMVLITAGTAFADVITLKDNSTLTGTIVSMDGLTIKYIPFGATILHALEKAQVKKVNMMHSGRSNQNSLWNESNNRSTGYTYNNRTGNSTADSTQSKLVYPPGSGSTIVKQFITGAVLLTAITAGVYYGFNEGCKTSSSENYNEYDSSDDSNSEDCESLLVLAVGAAPLISALGMYLVGTNDTVTSSLGSTIGRSYAGFGIGLAVLGTAAVMLPVRTLSDHRYHAAFIAVPIIGTILGGISGFTSNRRYRKSGIKVGAAINIKDDNLRFGIPLVYARFVQKSDDSIISFNGLKKSQICMNLVDYRF